MRKRSRVTTKFRPVAKSKRKKRIAERRARAWQTLREPKGLTPLAQYVDENLESGLSVAELIEQFQEYDCVHAYRRLASSPSTHYDVCDNCGKVEKRPR